MNINPDFTNALTRQGFKIVNDYPCFAAKTFQTICGEKIATICIFARVNYRAYATYHSEGRNILESVSIPLSGEAITALAECNKRIEQSYARNIWKSAINAGV